MPLLELVKDELGVVLNTNTFVSLSSLVIFHWNLDVDHAAARCRPCQTMRSSWPNLDCCPSTLIAVPISNLMLML